MGDTDTVLRGWIDFTVDVSRASTSFPSSTLLERLSSTFETTVGWNWWRADGEVGCQVLHPPPGWPPPSIREVWTNEMYAHPLVRWVVVSRALTPITLDRVPEPVADRASKARVREVMASPDMVRQLAIPVATDPSCVGSVQVSRGGRDFTDEEVLTATRLQPLLMVMDRQARLCAGFNRDVAVEYALTNREVAVLALLRRGLTTHAISRHLGCSPRTVDKHVEHLYRKLDVRDRLAAIRVTDNHTPRAGAMRRAHQTTQGATTPDEPRSPSAHAAQNHSHHGDLLIFADRLAHVLDP